jgi:hypothetical protein
VAEDLAMPVYLPIVAALLADFGQRASDTGSFITLMFDLKDVTFPAGSKPVDFDKPMGQDLFFSAARTYRAISAGVDVQ